MKAFIWPVVTLALSIFFFIHFPGISAGLIATAIIAYVFGLSMLIYQVIDGGEPEGMLPYFIMTISPLILGIAGASIMWG
jgi:hypothetical protein